MTPPTSRKTLTSLVVGVLVLGVGLTMAPSSSAAPANKKFTEWVSVNGQALTTTGETISAGPDQTFTFKIVNTSTGPTTYFGSWQVRVPTGLTVTELSGITTSPTNTNFDPPDYDTTAGTITGTSNGPNGSGMAQNGYVLFTVTADVPAEGICPATWTTRVKQSNDFSGSGNDFVGNSVSTPVAGSSRLAWGIQPTDMQYDTTPSPAPTVIAVDACGAPVTTSATVNISSAGGTLVTAATTATMTNGVATLSNLKYSDWEFDDELTATATGLGTAVSDEFHVYQFRKVCAASVTCSSPKLTGPLQQNYVSVLADSGTTSDVLTVSVRGLAEGNCGGTTDAPAIGEVVVLNMDSRSKHVTLTLPKQYVLINPNNGTPFMEVCLDTTVGGTVDGYLFTDKAGNQVQIGLLPDCSAVGGTPPCITDRKRKAGDEIITLDLPAGDPAVSWR
jgi:hypothetical protein